MLDRTSARRRRGAGEGSVYQAADGRWRGTLAWTDASGVRRRRYVSGPTSAVARERLAALRSTVAAGAGAPGGTVAEYLGPWLERERGRIRPATWRGRELHVRAYWTPTIGRVRLDRLSPADVESAMARLTARGLSARSVVHARATLRRALGDALRDGLVVRNVAALARPPRLVAHEVAYLDAVTVRRLLALVEPDPYLGPAVTVLVTCGLRVGELLGLAVSDVDPAAGTIAIRRSLALDEDGGYSLAETKTTRSRRTIVLPRLAVVALAARLATVEGERRAAGIDYTPSGLVFADPYGRPVTPDTFGARYRAAIAGSGIPGDLRLLRHSAATLALAAGAPLAAVSDFLGHASPTITMAHYAAVAPELRVATARALDAALGDKE